jgi:putative peptidoglycan lipid II flippase
MDPTLPAASPSVPTDAAATASRAASSRLVRGAAISSLAVMGSRVMGLLREQIFAFFFGASREYDAFLTAFRIPNLLRDLLAEGALSAAFISVFVKELHGQGKARAFHLANLVVNALSLVLVGVVLLSIVFAPSIVGAIALGFDPEKAALATQLTRVMFPYILLVAIAAVAMGMLNAQEHYAVPQSASTFFNITSIAVGLSCAYALSPHYMAGLWHNTAFTRVPAEAARAMLGMALGTLAGGLVQCAMQVPTLYRTGFRWRPVLDVHDPGFRAVLKLMGPAVIGAAAVQLNVFINSNFASTLGDKPISWLNYAFRLMQFPIGVFGVAVMTAALPAMARALAQNDQEKFGQTLTRSLELVLLLTLPASVGLYTLGEPIMRLIYQHGRFAAADTLATAAALSAYALGLPAYSAIKLLQPAFVALGDAKTPMYTSLAAVGLNFVLNYTFIKVLQVGHVGLALSTSAMATLNVTILCVVLERRRRTLERRRLASQVLRIALAAAVMGVFCSMCLPRLQHFLAAQQFASTSLRALLELAVLIPAATVLYLLATQVLQVKAFGAATQILSQRRQRRAG